MQNNFTDIFLSALESKAKQSLPCVVTNQAIMCLIDWLACAHLGSHMMEDVVRAFLDYGDERGGCSTIVGAQKRASMRTAALLNGMFAHVAELDDGHRFAMMHVGASVISALLAVAEHAAVDGACFLRGVVMGYESSVRLAASIQPAHKLKGFHASGTCGVVGAALGIAYMLDYNPRQVKATLSAAVTSASGLLEMDTGPSELKPYNVGHAAAAAVDAAAIGRMGLLAPDDALGGIRGFFRAMAHEVDEAVLLGGMGDDYAIETIYRKVHASCRHSHAAVDAAVEIARVHEIDIDAIESVVVETYGLAVAGHDHTRITGASTAKMSIPYCVAVALMYGDAGFARFDERHVCNKRIAMLTEKVSVMESPELSALVPAKRAAIVVVTEADGRSFSERVDFPRGEPESPIGKGGLVEKYRSLMEASGVSEFEACRLLELAWKADERFPAFLEGLRVCRGDRDGL